MKTPARLRSRTRRNRISPPLLAVAAAATLLALHTPARGGDLWDIYQTALRHDAAYRAAAHDYESARLDLPLAKSALRPSLAAQGSAGQLRTDPPEDGSNDGEHFTETDNQYALTAELPLYDGALRSAVKQARHSVSRATIRFAEARDDLILRVAEAYFQLLAARDRKEVALREQRAIRRQMDFAAERLAVGLGTRTDLFDAQARFQQAVADVIQSDNRIDNAVQALRQIIGATPEALAPLADDAPLAPPDPQTPEAWVRRALENNLALRAAGLDLKIAAEEIKKQRAARFPNIGLTATQRWRDSSGNAAANTDSASYGATLNWQLYRGNAIHLKTKQAALQFNAAEQRREALRRQVEAGATSAYLAVASGISQVNALAEAIRAGASALQAKEEGFRAGLTTNLDVLDAQRDLSGTRTDYLRARYDFILSVLRLEQAAGDLGEDDVQRVNAWLTGGE